MGAHGGTLFRSILGSEPAKTWIRTSIDAGSEPDIGPWIKRGISVTIPLNINLLIPFKDNEGARRNLYRKEVERFRDRLEARAAELRDDLITNFGEEFELTIAGRSDGTTTKYFWRFRSSKRDRKYVRLNAKTVTDYVRVLDPNQVLQLKDIEEELIYLNANLRLLKGFIDAIEQSESELVELRAADF